MLQVTIASAERVLFEGPARSVRFPGEQGIFEVLPFHHALVSRLLPGQVVIDDQQPIPIRRGLIRIAADIVSAVVELP